MTPDQHTKAKEIFLSACARPTEHRSTYISKACEGNETLLREVERLLEHHLTASPSDGMNPISSRTGLQDRPSDISELPTFQTGEMVADRYCIVSRLGEGAMGRVYRAEDGRLHQTVALKFLPKLHVLDPTWRRRVESEVKLSRDVGHSNICRVYDLGDFDGAPYISMEYIDGEDLASLLRRVGRLTGTRAIDIARQLCAGLAAAHIHGVLHRDLKPANVMIDHKGGVRITDFGLAVISGRVERGEIRAGTPRYMAPEQLAGAAVNESSDIYSLGLVLYEMFAGRPAFDAGNVLDYLRMHQTVEPCPPSEIVPEIDPRVEAVILACLRKDPAERPDSALNVAAALPGGDLLAAALDAGQIPTREMLAAAAAQGSVSRGGMYRATFVAMGLFLLAILVGNNTHPIAKGGGAKPPEVLLEKAREISRLAGLELPPGKLDGHYFPSADAEVSMIVSAESGAQVNLAIPAGDEVLFRCREKFTGVTPPGSEVLSFIMPTTTPFHIESRLDVSPTVILDGQGRLLLFESMAPPGEQFQIADWRSLVRVSGFDPEHLVPTKLLTISGVHAAEHLALHARSLDSPDRSALIEVAMSDNRVRFFAVLNEAVVQPASSFYSSSARWTNIRTVRNSVLLLLLAVALPGAWKNLNDRGDLIGALRVGGFVFVLRLLSGLASIRDLRNYSNAIENIAGGALGALCEGLIVALFYMALESHIRRLWPRTLGCWSRLLNGRIRDPFVGRDLLLGCVVGNFWAILVFIDRRLPAWMGWDTQPQLRLYQGLDDLMGARFAVAGVLNSLRGGIYLGMVVVFLLVIATWLAGRRRWLAVSAAWLIAAAMYAPTASHPVTAWTLFAMGCMGVGLYVVIHWGLVSLLSALMVLGSLTVFPITMDFSAWYAGYGVFAAATVVGFTLWGLYEATRSPVLETHPSYPP